METPKVHLWETGVIRITRHPQAVGQAMWSAAHLAMVPTTPGRAVSHRTTHAAPVALGGRNGEEREGGGGQSAGYWAGGIGGCEPFTEV